MNGKNTMRKRIAVLIVAVVIALFAVIRFRVMIMEEIQTQLSANLRDVANQNIITMENALNKKRDLLNQLAAQIESKYKQLDSEETQKEIINYLEPFMDIHDFIRMGVVLPSGIAFCTDGYMSGLDNTEPYIYGMQGLSNVTSRIEEGEGEAESVNVFSVPLFGADNETVIGILCGTCRTETFKEMLNVDSFNGLGYSYVIEGDGSVVTDSKQSPMYGTTNVFESMMQFSEDNATVISEIKDAMVKRQSGDATFISASKRYLHYAPLRVESLHESWYLFTIVPAEVLDEKSEDVLHLNNMMLLAIFVVLIATVVYFIWNTRKSSEELRILAYEDALTKGDNYLCFVEKLKKCKGVHGYIISADINEFKLVNNTCGIEKGNETLQCIWKIIAERLKEGELAAHINADHYVMFLREDKNEDVIRRVGEISEAIVELASKINIVSILPYFGIYQTMNLEDPEESYSKANQAKHLVRGNRKKNWAFYEEVDYDRMVEDKNLEDSFEKAIQNHEFEMWYQPKYSGTNEEIVGAEALVRWRREDGTLVPPFRFIPLFEKNGMITTLDEYVFKTVCLQQKKWEREGHKLFPVSVNISRVSLYFENIVEKYKEIMEECAIAPEWVPLEITESATLDNNQVQDLVEKFHAAGFQVHLDDFGNGYSSLAMLNLMHFDTLKLDKSLIDFVGDENGEKLLWHTITLAKSLGMHTTAEGVERKEQVEFLHNLQCDDIQGYYYSKPLSLDGFEELIFKQ